MVSFIDAVIHKLRLGDQVSWLAGMRFVVPQAGALMISGGLFLLYGGFVPSEQIEKRLAPSSIIVFVAAIMMMAMVLKPQSKH